MRLRRCGGVLADAYGYSFTFLITASIQAAATVLQATLLPLVPRAEKRAAPKPATDEDGSGEAGGTSSVAAAAAPPNVAVTPLCAPTVAASVGGRGSIQSEARHRR